MQQVHQNPIPEVHCINTCLALLIKGKIMVERVIHRLDMRTWVGLFLLGISFWVVINGHTVILEVATAIFSGVLASTLLRPAADLFEERAHIRRSLCISIMLAMAQVPMLLLAGFMIRLGLDLAGTLVDGLDQFDVLSEASVSSMPAVQGIIDTLAQQGDQVMNSIIDGSTAIASNVSGLIYFSLLLFLANAVALALAEDPEAGRRLIKMWVPPSYQEPLFKILERTEWRLKKWVLAQLGSMSFFAICFTAGLSIIGVPYAPVIGFLGGFMEIAPGFGGFLAYLLAILSAVTTGDVYMLLWVTALYVIVLVLQLNILGPMMMEKGLKLHGTQVLIAMILGGTVNGIWGSLFAIPVLVVIIAFLEEVRTYYLSADDGLQDEVVEAEVANAYISKMV